MVNTRQKYWKGTCLRKERYTFATMSKEDASNLADLLRGQGIDIRFRIWLFIIAADLFWRGRDQSKPPCLRCKEVIVADLLGEFFHTTKGAN
jgi:hypothetical protein